jgi:hypothetical protein
MDTPLPPPTHSHGTRGNTVEKKQQHTAATVAAATFHSDEFKNAGYNKKLQKHANNSAAAAMFHMDAYHCALHSTAINPDTGHNAEYCQLRACSDGAKWIDSCADEIGRLCNGLGPNSKTPTSTNTLFFIPISAMPKDQKATYIGIVCADHPEKVEKQQRVHFTVGGDQVDYPGAVSTKTADLATAKILINSVLSTPGAKYMTGDLKDFYLNTPMER